MEDLFRVLLADDRELFKTLLNETLLKKELSEDEIILFSRLLKVNKGSTSQEEIGKSSSSSSSSSSSKSKRQAIVEVIDDNLEYLLVTMWTRSQVWNELKDVSISSCRQYFILVLLLDSLKCFLRLARPSLSLQTHFDMFITTSLPLLCQCGEALYTYEPSLSRLLNILSLLLNRTISSSSILPAWIDIFRVITAYMKTASFSILTLFLKNDTSVNCALIDSSYNFSLLSSFLTLSLKFINHTANTAIITSSSTSAALAQELLDILLCLLRCFTMETIMDLMSGNDDDLSLFLLHFIELEAKYVHATAEESSCIQLALLELKGLSFDSLNMFTYFLSNVVFCDVTVFIDLLTQPDTVMLTCFLRFLKLVDSLPSLKVIKGIHFSSSATSDNSKTHSSLFCPTNKTAVGKVKAIIWIASADFPVHERAIFSSPSFTCYSPGGQNFRSKQVFDVSQLTTFFQELALRLTLSHRTGVLAFSPAPLIRRLNGIVLKLQSNNS